MDPTEMKRILDQTECIFTWKRDGIRLRYQGLMNKFENYAKNDERRPSYVQKWRARVCLGYLLFQRGESFRALKEIDKALKDLADTEDRLNQKYRVSCQHIVYAMKGWMKYELQELENVSNIPLQENMSDLEKAGLYGFKANILRELVGKEVVQLSPFLKRAMELDPLEYEWKISLVCNLTRSRRYARAEEGHGARHSIPESAIAERMEIIESLLNDTSITPQSLSAALYYKAETLKDYVLHKPPNAAIDEKRRQIDSLWRGILESDPENDTYIEFGAKWIFLDPQDHQNMDLIVPLILNGLERSPKKRNMLQVAHLVKKHLSSCTPACVLRASENALRIVELLKRR